MRIEAGIDVAQGDEAADEQGGTDQQDERERDLADDQQRAGLALTESGAGAVAAFLERGVEVGARGSDGGEQTEENAGKQRDAEGEGEHPPIDADGGAMLADAGNIAGAEGQQAAHADEAEHQSEDPSGDGEQNAFREQLADDARAAGSHGGANGEFTLASCSADQQKIGDIGAGDEKDEAHGSDEHEKRRSHIADNGIAERLDAECFFRGRACWVATAELIGGNFHLGVGLGQGHSWLEAACDQEVVALIVAVGIELEGKPDVSLRVGIEGFSDDAEDGVGLIAEHQSPADDVRVATKAYVATGRS